MSSTESLGTVTEMPYVLGSDGRGNISGFHQRYLGFVEGLSLSDRESGDDCRAGERV